MPTSIKEAITKWEERTGEKAVEASRVELYGQQPPIDKMDATLGILTNCERLSLSTNNIEKIAGLNALKKLKILSLGRNSIKSFAGIENLGDTLEEIWISYNLIDRVKGLSALKKLKHDVKLIPSCRNDVKLLLASGFRKASGIKKSDITKSADMSMISLPADKENNGDSHSILYMSHNLIKDFAEVTRLNECPHLVELVLVGNPVYEKYMEQGDWQTLVPAKLKSLRKLDGLPIIRDEDDDASQA